MRIVALAPSPLTVAVNARGEAFVIAADDSVRVLDTHTGGWLHTISVRNLSLAIPTLVIDNQANRIVVAGDREVIVLDARNGYVARRITVDMWIQGMAVDTRHRRILVAGYNGTTPTGMVCVINERNGHLLHTTLLNESPGPGALTVDERRGRTIVVDRSTDSVTALDTESGRVLWTEHIGLFPQAVSVDERTGRAYIGAETGDHVGRILVLDGESGRHLRMTRLEGPPIAVGVNTRTRQAFVVIQDSQGGRIDVLDTVTGRPVRSIPLSMTPRAAAINDTGTSVIVGLASDQAPKRVAPWTWLPPAIRRWLPLPPPSLSNEMGGRVVIFDEP